VPVQERFVVSADRPSRTRVGMGKIEAKYVHHRTQAANDADALAKIHLRVTGGCARARTLPSSAFASAARNPSHRVTPHTRTRPEPLENPLGVWRCLAGGTAVRFQIASITGVNGPASASPAAWSAGNPRPPKTDTSGDRVPASAQTPRASVGYAPPGAHTGDRAITSPENTPTSLRNPK